MQRTRTRTRKTKSKKTQNKKIELKVRERPDAILTADVEFRENTPQCRTDDFISAMLIKLRFIFDLQEKWSCPVLAAGDIFDYWKASPWLLAQILPYIKHWISVPGQHDLPQHSWELYDKSGLAVLEAAGPKVMRVLREGEEYYCSMTDNPFLVSGYGWNVKPTKGGDKEPNIPQVALIHRMTYPDKPPYPGAEKDGGNAKTLMRKMKNYDLIVSGDNHETFIEGGKDQLLVNPGSVMRTTADQMNHKPCVYLWYAKENYVDHLFLPTKEGVVSREHIDIKEERDTRIEAFVEGLKEGIEFGVSYRENLELFFKENNIKNNVQEINRRALGDE